MIHLDNEEILKLSERFESAHPASVLEWVSESFAPGAVAMATGFGAEGVALVDMIASVGKNIPIFYLDTDVLFPETYALRDRLEETYGIRLIRYASRFSIEQQAESFGSNLWASNPDLCCNIRKVEPLREALKIIRAG